MIGQEEHFVSPPSEKPEGLYIDLTANRALELPSSEDATSSDIRFESLFKHAYVIRVDSYKYPEVWLQITIPLALKDLRFAAARGRFNYHSDGKVLTCSPFDFKVTIEYVPNSETFHLQVTHKKSGPFEFLCSYTKQQLEEFIAASRAQE